ncbi:hypothetical protein JZ751_019864 [Albula glossodonta]|uniref:Chemokine interleukin-8-like domain-containing protein n=1 Tax=Albula glossodonta TaxID=121402 RepID=A0A8T2NPK0_9TELE|nr:hypothetical protein JZ751_019864 [Albula glossodonta]
MKFSLHTPCLFVALSICALLYKARVGESTFVPTRCLCTQTYRVVRGPFVDFSVTSKGPHCSTDEIIVKLQRNNKEVCLSPDGPQAKRLKKCWNRKSKNGGNKKKCLRKRGNKKQGQKRGSKQSKGATS